MMGRIRREVAFWLWWMWCVVAFTALSLITVAGVTGGAILVLKWVIWLWGVL